MKKKKVLTILLFCLWIGTWTSGVEVINIDINNYGNDLAYEGQGAYPGGNEWIVYYGGWGVAVGSQRSADLVNQGDDAVASTYAEQVWIGDAGGHEYLTGAGTGLLDDGFIGSGGENNLNDPNIAFMGEGAYGSDFDMYVYGSGTFTLVDGNDILGSQEAAGTASGFEEGVNYVIFEDIPLGNPNTIRLYYTNELNGIQLISRKTPVAVTTSTDPNDNLIDARNYDVAFDTNARSGELTFYGPDLADYVHYLDTGEYMEYDLIVDTETQGRYYLSADFVTYWGGAGLNMYLDDTLIGTLTQEQHSEDSTIYRSLEDLPVNLFAGTHTLRWENTQNYFDVVQLRLTYDSEITLETCEDVYLYGLEPAGDLNTDCRVNIEDLAIVAENWLINYDPEAQ